MSDAKLVHLSPQDTALLTEIASAMRPREREIALRWHELYGETRSLHRARERTVRSFRYAVRLLLTSLANGDVAGYLRRVRKAGASFARAKERYENLVLFLHFYEEAVAPYLLAAFPDRIGTVRCTLEHLHHGLVAIMSQAYFRELEKDREHFLGTLVHDLRNPLIGMTGLARIMTERNVPKDRKDQLLRIIRDSGNRMSSLIDHAMTYGRLKSGRAFAIASDVDVVEIAREAATMLLPETGESALTVTINGRRLAECGCLAPVTGRTGSCCCAWR